MKTDFVPALNHFDYFTDIEKTFIKRRGKHLMIGPLDWALIESWQEREIPLRIVLTAINEVFDSIEQRAESTVNVRSLKYCNDAVERLFKEWSAAHIGGHPGNDDPAAGGKAQTGAGDTRRHIEQKLSELESVLESVPQMLKAGIRSAIEVLSAINEDENESDAEQKLEKIESDLDDLILRNREELLEQDVESAVSAALKSFGRDTKMTGNAFERVFCKEVRRKYSIPRLSMFEL